MKRLIFSFLVLCTFLLYNYCSEKYVLDYCTKIDSILEICAEEIKEEKYSQAQGTVSILLNDWENNDIILSVFIGDNSIIEPQKSIISIYRSLGDENYSYCLFAIRECQGYFHEIYENTQTNLGNVL